MRKRATISLAYATLAAIAALGARARAAGAAPAPNRGTRAEGVTVYHRFAFDGDAEGWSAANGGVLRLADDAVEGRALLLECRGSWAAARRSIHIAGSRRLKIALMMKGRGLESVGINVHDDLARDNTTAYGYRDLREGRWTPILYFLDRFRYNARSDGFVSARTAYDEIRFYGPHEVVPGAAFAIDDLTIYRGRDATPPKAVEGLVARATEGGVGLAWKAARDDVGVQVYAIARAEGGDAFEKIAESPIPAYLDATAGRGRYRYRVLAVDFEENLGPWSEPVEVDARGPGRKPAPTREEKDRLAYADHVRRVHARGAGRVRRGHATLFGDSLTGATSYPRCVQAALRTMTANAFGFASMRTDFGRRKVEEILQRESPEFLLILFGTNNSKAERAIPPAMGDLAAIAKACEDRGTVPILGTIPPRGWSAASAPEAGYNRHVAALCRRLAIPTAFIFEAFQAAGDRRRYLAGDGVHWREPGMRLAARAWARAVEQVRFVLRDRP